MTDKYQTIAETLIHIDLVSSYLESIKLELSKRQYSHDRSKLQPEELDVFVEYTPKLKASEYNSPEYHQNLAEMKVALDHHYAHNRHHPQWFQEGVMGMTLIDLIEMLVDWKSSTERTKDGCIYKSIEINKDRFNIPEPIVQILRNTADKLDNPFRDLTSQANL